jgi:hypothetical protein
MAHSGLGMKHAFDDGLWTAFVDGSADIIAFRFARLRTMEEA